MNSYLEQFVNKTFSKQGSALDLGAGKFFDVACMKQLGWKCEGVDLNTDVDLEKPYLSKEAPFDLVFCNYTLQKLKNQKQLIKTVRNNLKSGGWFFLHTFDESDKNSTAGVKKEFIGDLLREAGFHNIGIEIFDFYDNDVGHKHWHRILEVTAQKVTAA